MDKDHDNTFKTPKGYFESFNEQLFARLEAEEGEPNTDFLPKSDGFTIPKGYLDKVYPTIQSKLNNSRGKVISFRQRNIFYYAAAAVAVLFVVTIGVNWNQSPDLSFDDLASADIETYFENNEFGLSSYEIAENMDLEEISITDITEQRLQEESILEYLDEHVDHLEDLDLNYEELEY